MTWYTGDPRDAPIFDEIEKQTDRGAALIAVGLLDRVLMDAVQARMFLVGDADRDISGRLFKGTGSLSSLSSRIDAGYLMEMYPEEVHKLLHAIRNIRNDFAHDPSPIHFLDNSIKQKCDNLKPLALKVSWFGFDFAIGLSQSFGRSKRGATWAWGTDSLTGPRQIFLESVKVCVFLIVWATESWANARPKARLPTRGVMPVQPSHAGAPSPSRPRTRPKKPPSPSQA